MLSGVQAPTDPLSWLTPDPTRPMHFTSAEHGVTFMPYYELGDQLMTVYPAYVV